MLPLEAPHLQLNNWSFCSRQMYWKFSSITREMKVMEKEYFGYTVTSQGKVFNKRGRELAGEITQNGYHRVTLSIDGKSKRFLTHRLVAELFIPNPKEVVNHKDGDKLNNSVDNLEWTTQKENIKHALETGLKKPVSTKGYGQGRKTLVAKVDLETGEELEYYSSMSEAARENGGSFQLISAVIQGKRKSHKGFNWKKK